MRPERRWRRGGAALALALMLALCPGGAALSEAAETPAAEAAKPAAEAREAGLDINGSAEAVALEPGAQLIDLDWEAIPECGGWHVQIYGANRTLVFEKTLGADRDSMTLDISRCPPGVYEARLSTDYMDGETLVTVTLGNTFEVRAPHEVLYRRMDASRQLLAYIDGDGSVRLASGYNGQADGGTLPGDIPWREMAGAAQVAVGSDHLVALTEDGAVMGAGGNGAGQLNCVGLEGVRWIAAGSGCTACVMDSGEIRLFGAFGDAQGPLQALTGASEISVSDTHAAVRCMDGTARAFPLSGGDGDAVGSLEGWTDLKQVSAGYGYVLGLTNDGTVLYAGPADGHAARCADWRGVTAVAAGNGYALGLTAEGTVLSAGNPNLVFTDTAEWQGISEIAAGYYLCAGLRSDGTIEIQAE